MPANPCCRRPSRLQSTHDRNHRSCKGPNSKPLSPLNWCPCREKQDATIHFRSSEVQQKKRNSSTPSVAKRDKSSLLRRHAAGSIKQVRLGGDNYLRHHPEYLPDRRLETWKTRSANIWSTQAVMGLPLPRWRCRPGRASAGRTSKRYGYDLKSQHEIIARDSEDYMPKPCQSSRPRPARSQNPTSEPGSLETEAFAEPDPRPPLWTQTLWSTRVKSLGRVASLPGGQSFQGSKHRRPVGVGFGCQGSFRSSTCSECDPERQGS